MCALERPLTYDDLLQMPDDGLRREVIGGELFVNPAPRRAHQEVSANTHWILQQFFRSTRKGKAFAHPVDVYLGRTDVVQPDLIAIRSDRLHIYRPEGVVVEPPDLVVEIISPSSRSIDRVRKMALYARAGVPEYWIADPEQRAFAVNVLTGEDYVSVAPNPDGTISSRVFPGLRVDLAEVFAGLD